MNRDSGGVNSGADDALPTGDMRETGAASRSTGRLFFYGAVTLLVAGSFLAEILRGDCPVP